jgi:hypothetical protein
MRVLERFDCHICGQVAQFSHTRYQEKRKCVGAYYLWLRNDRRGTKIP